MLHDNLVGVYPSSPKQMRSKLKKEALIQSGRELFVLQGFEKTTAKEIAAHAQVSIGTFYRYFSDKRQLLMSLIEEQMDALMPLELEWKSGDPEKVLAGRLALHFHNINKEHLQKLMPELLLKDAQLAEVMNEAKSKFREKFLANLTYLDEKELLWSDLDRETLIWCMESLLEKLRVRISQGKEVDYQQFAKAFCRLLFPPEAVQKMRTGEIE
ncbi:TetR/AcrR family transcriptional regulator [Planomicrobium okeanokoites]|uniref:TetR/AcrR family transcriptional regulator n=1 Tax=Planomicrobium okeanokoites TaxID=244 RepID=UPI00249299F9|nr:TetR/AcrR family transcriptional regulator [Planomicrobium okeanokoites]